MRKVLAVVAISLGFLGCQEEFKVEDRQLNRPGNYQLTPDLGLTETRGRLISATRIVSFTKDEVTEKIAGIGVPAANGIHIYKVVYRSEDINGNPMDLSGAVFVPDSQAPALPLISLSHGTMTSKDTAPSVRPGEGVFESSQGFMVAAMDYVGFGESSNVPHPYLIEDFYVRSGVDMIRATREFAAINETGLVGLFLKGYSEGGYATMAIHKAMETQPELKEEFIDGPFKLLASAPGAGPYLLSTMAAQLVNGDSVNPIYLTKVAYGYKYWYPTDIPAPYSDFFNNEGFAVETEDQLAGKLATLLSGSYSYFQLLELLPKTKEALIDPSLLEDYANVTFNQLGLVANPEADETGLLSKLQDNHLVKNWSPSVATRLYHCEKDDVVPADVSVTSKKLFDFYYDQNPTTENPNVSLVVVPDPEGQYQHNTCPAIFMPAEWFGSILQNLQNQQ